MVFLREFELFKEMSEGELKGFARGLLVYDILAPLYLDFGGPRLSAKEGETVLRWLRGEGEVGELVQKVAKSAASVITLILEEDPSTLARLYDTTPEMAREIRPRLIEHAKKQMEEKMDELEKLIEDEGRCESLGVTPKLRKLLRIFIDKTRKRVEEHYNEWLHRGSEGEETTSSQLRKEIHFVLRKVLRELRRELGLRKDVYEEYKAGKGKLGRWEERFLQENPHILDEVKKVMSRAVSVYTSKRPSDEGEREFESLAYQLLQIIPDPDILLELLEEGWEGGLYPELRAKMMETVKRILRERGGVVRNLPRKESFVDRLFNEVSTYANRQFREYIVSLWNAMKEGRLEEERFVTELTDFLMGIVESLHGNPSYFEALLRRLRHDKVINDELVDYIKRIVKRKWGWEVEID